VVKKLNVFSYNSGIDQNAVLKLKNEIEVYRKLNHENIVKYIGSEIVSNQFCIYLEYLAGGNI
jgi:serine/threonine protein kinase